MEPDYQAKIYLPNNLWMEIAFARPLDIGVLHSLKDFVCKYEGFFMRPYVAGKPLWIDLNPLYNYLTVAREIEKILRSEGFTSLIIKIDEVGHARSVLTLLE